MELATKRNLLASRNQPPSRRDPAKRETRASEPRAGAGRVTRFVARLTTSTRPRGREGTMARSQTSTVTRERHQRSSGVCARAARENRIGDRTYGCLLARRSKRGSSCRGAGLTLATPSGTWGTLIAGTSETSPSVKDRGPRSRSTRSGVRGPSSIRGRTICSIGPHAADKNMSRQGRRGFASSSSWSDESEDWTWGTNRSPVGD